MTDREKELREAARHTPEGQLLVRYGFEPWDTESAARRVAEKAAAEIARLQAKIDNITAQGIHSCHPDCQRPLCVLRRERDAAREASRELGKALERVLPHAEELSRSGLTDETCAEARRTLEKYGTKPVNFD